MCNPEIPLMQFRAINTGRYQAGVLPQSTHMYSWPMNNYWGTNFNADQMGEMKWSYCIKSSADNSVAYATKFAWENRIPFLTRVLQATEGPQAAGRLAPASLLNILPENILLVNMAPVKGEKAVMLQLREIGGKKAEFSVESDKVKIKGITECDVVGKPLSDSDLTFTPWENKFVKIRFR